MAAYPTLPLQPGSLDQPSQRAESYVDGAGGHKVYWPAQKKRWTLKHILTEAQRDTLKAFFVTNQFLTITFTWGEDGVTYNAVFLDQPRIAGIDKFPGHREVTVELGEA